MTQMTKMYTSEVHEDNAGCICLATDEEQYRPRTKHIAVRWHHFRDQIKNGNIKITKVDSAYNWADIFTKPLTKVTFEALRLLMMGW